MMNTNNGTTTVQTSQALIFPQRFDKVNKNRKKGVLL